MLHHELKGSINKGDNNPLFCLEKYPKTKKNYVFKRLSDRPAKPRNSFHMYCSA